MRGLLAGLAFLAALGTAAGQAGAGAMALCEEPIGFGGPVQVFVLQYGFEPSEVEADRRLADSARRLSYLIQLDVLANDSYGSIASILLQEERPGSCRAVEVLDRLLDFGALRPGQAAAVVWGRIYREGDDILVQTYLRFLRVDPGEPRSVDERFEVALSDPPVRLEGTLPSQTIAFAPRRLSAERLDRIDADWRAAVRLYDRPDENAGSRELPPAEARFAYYVREMTQDGWLGVELPQIGERGWLKADPEVGRSLRELMPELDFVDGVIGYLSYRQAAGGRGFPMPPAPWMLERIEKRFAHFTEVAGEPGDDAAVLAATLRGTLEAFSLHGDTAAGLELLTQALRQRPEDGKLRNLVTMAELRRCCSKNGTGPALRQVPKMLLAGLAVDPNNADLLSNLQATYAWLAGEPEDGRPAGPLAEATAQVNANLRAGPGTETAKVGLARSGSRLTITGTNETGEWLRVERGDEPDAYVLADLLKDVRPLAGASARLECSDAYGRVVCRSGPSEIAPDPPAPSARLAEAGLSTREVSERLQQVKELRRTLGQLD